MASHRGAGADRQTIGLIGFGGIAAESRGSPGGSGMRVRRGIGHPGTAAGVTSRRLDRLLAESDVVSCICLLTDETRNFLSAERIARIKPARDPGEHARAAVVDEAAMIAALKSGSLRHAAAGRVSTRSRCRRAIH